MPLLCKIRLPALLTKMTALLPNAPLLLMFVLEAAASELACVLLLPTILFSLRQFYIQFLLCGLILCDSYAIIDTSKMNRYYA